MARYEIKLVVEEGNIKTVEKKLRQHFGKDSVSATAKKIETNRSRADRLGDAQQLVEDAKGEVESLKDEVQDWYDNLPEAFQNGEKGERLQECIDSLEQLHSDLDNCSFEAEFPGMYD